MVKFCPFDGSVLMIDSMSSGMRYNCCACPYVFNITQHNKTVDRTINQAKKVDDVLGGADAWKNTPQTETTCNACFNKKAYYMQIQTRSADEPMTIFYKCTKCGIQWKE